MIKNNVLSNNKRALNKYIILDKYDAGIALAGTEVKAIKHGKMNLSDSFGQIKKGELFLINAHIGQYSKDANPNYNPKRDRKLLLKKSEINGLNGKLHKGLTLVPLKAYSKKGLIKIEIGIAKPKKMFNKRNELKNRDQKRETEREIKNL